MCRKRTYRSENSKLRPTDEKISSIYTNSAMQEGDKSIFSNFTLIQERKKHFSWLILLHLATLASVWVNW